MTLYKNVDGERIKMSAAEETSTRAEWARHENPVVTAEQIEREIEDFLLRTNWVWEGDHGRSVSDVVATKGFRTAMINADRTPRPRDLGLQAWEARFGRFGR